MHQDKTRLKEVSVVTRLLSRSISHFGDVFLFRFRNAILSFSSGLQRQQLKFLSKQKKNALEVSLSESKSERHCLSCMSQNSDRSIALKFKIFFSLLTQ